MFAAAQVEFDLRKCFSDLKTSAVNVGFLLSVPHGQRATPEMDPITKIDAAMVKSLPAAGDVANSKLQTLLPLA